MRKKSNFANQFWSFVTINPLQMFRNGLNTSNQTGEKMNDTAQVIPFNDFQRAKHAKIREGLRNKFLDVLVNYCPNDTSDFDIYKRLINAVTQDMIYQFPELDSIRIGKRDYPTLKWSNGVMMYVNAFGDIMVTSSRYDDFNTYAIDQIEGMKYPEAIFFVPHVSADPG